MMGTEFYKPLNNFGFQLYSFIDNDSDACFVIRFKKIFLFSWLHTDLLFLPDMFSRQMNRKQQEHFLCHNQLIDVRSVTVYSAHLSLFKH